MNSLKNSNILFLVKFFIKKNFPWIVHKRRKYYRLERNLRLVDLRWLLKLKLINLFSGKIKVGFGPVKTGESTLSTRKWHIDPIINCINKNSKRYVCDIFFYDSDLSRFDIVVIVKDFDKIDDNLIKKLKKDKIFIYHVVDNPDGSVKRSYESDKGFVNLMDGVIIANPLQRENLDKNKDVKLIETPIITKYYKKNSRTKGNVVVFWEGVSIHLKFTEKLSLIIKELNKTCKHRVNLVYFTDMPSKDEGIIKYVKWDLEKRQDVFLNSDIAVTIKPMDDKYQQKKPLTKVLNYAAAGLPVICTPSEADKLVIEHGKTGFFAYTDKDWHKYLKMLIENPILREEMGKAAREHAIRNFSVRKITRKYTDFFDEIISKNKRF